MRVNDIMFQVSGLGCPLCLVVAIILHGRGCLISKNYVIFCHEHLKIAGGKDRNFIEDS